MRKVAVAAYRAVWEVLETEVRFRSACARRRVLAIDGIGDTIGPLH